MQPQSHILVCVIFGTGNLTGCGLHGYSLVSIPGLSNIVGCV